MPRRSRRDLEDLARWVVHTRLRIDPATGSLTTIEGVIAAAKTEERPIWTARDVQRLYRRAFSQGLVRVDVRVEDVGGSDPEHEALGAALTEAARAQPGASRHVVARVVEVWPADRPAPTGVAADHELHRRLGHFVGARVISDHLVPGDRVGISAGRAVAGAVDGLRTSRGLGGLRLYGLTGAAERHHGVVAGTSLDGDSIIRHAVSRCDPDDRPEKVRYMTLPRALPPHLMAERDPVPGTLLRDVAGYVLDDWWSEHRPDVVLLGASNVGSDLDDRHPLAVTRNPFVARAFDRLAALQDRHGPDGLRIGELAHRCWVASGADGPGGAEAEGLCDEIDACVVAPTLTALAHGRRRIVIAGGLPKADVLTSLLRGGCDPLRPSMVVTDVATAEAVLVRLG